MAANQAIRDKYFVTIGIECHVQLKTKTKLFSGAGNDAREAPSNSLINHIDLGMPGALPVLNEVAVELAAKAAFALGTQPQKNSKFDRKHYFYPDLPSGYQITQFYNPIIKDGVVEFENNGESKKVRIHEAHLEADAGKSTHPAGKDYSLVDLNRAGTPLLEIVSEPDIHSPSDARAYARELWLLVRHAGVSDANLYYGNMRFDVNVSVNKDRDKLGTRTETKNLNSFRSVEKAAEYEINRQIELLEKGQSIVQETRGWDDSKQSNFSQRSKEEAHDYRYMPDPDLPPLELDDKYIERIQQSMPLMPSEYRGIFRVLNLDQSAVDSLIASPENAKLIAEILEQNPAHAKRIANWIVNITSNDEDSAQDIKSVDIKMAMKLSQMVEDKKLSSSAAKEVWVELSVSGGDPEKIATDKNLLQVSDEAEIQKIVAQVINENSKAAEDVKNGEMKAIGFLVGQVMKQSRGKANPAMAQELIKKQLGI